MALSIATVPVNVDFSPNQIGTTFVHLHVPISDTAPFRVIDSARGLLTLAWENCLSAALEPVDGLAGSQLIVFPEFSLPSDAIPKIEATIRSDTCPPNTVVITGTEWLDASQYAQLLTNSSNPQSLRSKCPPDGQYANPAIIWIKTADNVLERYVQTKLRPSRQESASHSMSCGEDVMLFVSNGPDVVSFSVLICFDCIAVEGHKPMFEQLIDAAPSLPNSSTNWHLLLVPQYNKAPEHPEFLEFAESFLYRGGYTYNTADSAVAFINASAAEHGRSVSGFGRSSIFYRSDRWQSIPVNGPLADIPGTYAIEKLPKTTLIRARFREDGPSLHRFEFLKPWKTLRAAGSSRIPLLYARSRNINPDGSLTSWHSVSVLPKVFTDWLRRDLASRDIAFSGEISLLDEYVDIRTELLSLAATYPGRLNEIIYLLLLGLPVDNRVPAINPDHWQKPAEEWRNDAQGQAIVQLAATSSLLRLLNTISFSDPSPLCCGYCGPMRFVVIDGNNQHPASFLVAQYTGWLDRNPIGNLIGKKTVLILSRTTTVDLNTSNNIAERVIFHIDVDSHRDRAALKAINPILVDSTEDITSDGTQFFKHFAVILRNALHCTSKAQAAHYLQERLSNAI